MNKIIDKLFIVVTLITFIFTHVSATYAQRVFAAYNDAYDLSLSLSTKCIKKIIRDLDSDTIQFPEYIVLSAELKKNIGLMNAFSDYLKAIKLDESDNTIPLLYGDYLRIYRGAEKSLVRQAESAYRMAIKTNTNDTIKENISRSAQWGLLSVNESNGILIYPSYNTFLQNQNVNNLEIWFSSNNSFFTSMGAGNENDDLRSLTAEALTVLLRNFNVNNRLEKLVRKKSLGCRSFKTMKNKEM